MSGPDPSRQPGSNSPPEPARTAEWVPYLDATPSAPPVTPQPLEPQPTPPSRPHATKTYVVPRRFGMAAILAMNTLLSFLFAILAWYQAHPGVFVFFVVLALSICLAQMFYGKNPRLASAVAGAILILVFVAGSLVVSGELWILPCAGFPLFLVGAGLGYLAGTLAAGLFLLADLFTAWWNNRNDATKGNGSAGDVA